MMDEIPEEPWDDPELLWELYRERDLSQREIAYSFGCDKSKVLEGLIRHNVLQPWTNKEALAKAIEDYQTPSAIAEAWHCSELTIRRWMDEHGIKKRAELTESLLRELYVSQNLTTQEIAQDLHRTPVEVHFKLKEYGIERRDGSHRFR